MNFASGDFKYTNLRFGSYEPVSMCTHKLLEKQHLGPSKFTPKEVLRNDLRFNGYRSFSLLTDAKFGFEKKTIFT